KAQIIKYAGAGNPGYILSKGEFYLLGHEKFQIGSREFLNKYESSGMVNCIFEFQKGDKLYLFTDGFQDQFGGMDNKKLGKKKLLSMLKQNSNLPMCSQLDTLVGYFNEWMGDNEQVDDVTVLGIEL
ncbi:MAG TPA: SpoIIE family protein phosphatase, partial [Saprospiraceae bacterium]|nr:SpoIIE family protein phosphatase [Saprospiraceae bacterium]